MNKYLDIDFELMEEENMELKFKDMRAENIKPYDIVTLRDNELFIVLEDNDGYKILVGFDDIIPFTDYYSDLTHMDDRDNDIVEVRRSEDINELRINNWQYMNPIWVRKVKMTTQELYDKLGYWVEIVE